MGLVFVSVKPICYLCVFPTKLISQRSRQETRWSDNSPLRKAKIKLEEEKKKFLRIQIAFERLQSFKEDELGKNKEDQEQDRQDNMNIKKNRWHSSVCDA